MSTKTQGHRHSGQAGNAETRDGSAEKPAPAGQTISAGERSRLIQERAYGLWEQAGRPDGDSARERFWCEAEAEIMACHANDMACHANGK
jgi:hypothetical protein